MLEQAYHRCRDRAKHRADEEHPIGRFAEKDPVIVQVPVRIELVAFGAPEAKHDDREQWQQQSDAMNIDPRGRPKGQMARSTGAACRRVSC